MDEFALIQRFFASHPVARRDVVLGIGDDAALLQVPAGHELVVSTDVFAAGVHFPEHTDPEAVGHKALAVNLSDLAAMGADPAWFTLNLSLPESDEPWLTAFARGLFRLADEYGVALVGGDTTRSRQIVIGIQIMGHAPAGMALRRRGARAGDGIYVTGELGAAAVALEFLEDRMPVDRKYHAAIRERLDRPMPRVREGRALRGIASACIDLSDGLVADLGHILEASGVGARVLLANIPLAPVLQEPQVFRLAGWEAAIAGGDDYELCFTVPPEREANLQECARRWKCGLRRIGRIEAEPGLRLIDPTGHPYTAQAQGYAHF